MERSSFFNAVLDQGGNPDRAYLAEDFAKYFSSFIGNGVFPNPANQLQVVAVDNNMQIRLKQGMAWINGYFYVNTDDLILKIEPADGVLSRTDRIILRLDFLNREIKAKVKKGSFASSPVAPVLQRDADAYEIAVSDVNVRNGVIKINQSDIMDTRLNKNVCGIVHGIIDQVDTTEIFRQYQAWFLENKTLHENDFEVWMKEFKTVVGKKFTDWVDDIKNSLDPNEDIAAQLQMQISANKSSLDDKALKSDLGNINDTSLDSSLKGKSLTQMAKVLFQNADNAQKGISTVIGSPLSASDTLTSQQTKIQGLKNTFATNLTSKGQLSQGTETLNNLINKVPNISTKIQYKGEYSSLPVVEITKDNVYCVNPSAKQIFKYDYNGNLISVKTITTDLPLVGSSADYYVLFDSKAWGDWYYDMNDTLIYKTNNNNIGGSNGFGGNIVFKPPNFRFVPGDSDSVIYEGDKVITRGGGITSVFVNINKKVMGIGRNGCHMDEVSKSYVSVSKPLISFY